eukprot:3328295-Rhodomonas_salina.3
MCGTGCAMCGTEAGGACAAVRELLRAAQSQSLTNLRQQDLGPCCCQLPRTQRGAVHLPPTVGLLTVLRTSDAHGTEVENAPTSTQVSNGVEGQNVSEEHSMVVIPIVLRRCYAVTSTNRGYATTRTAE